MGLDIMGLDIPGLDIPGLICIVSTALQASPDSAALMCMLHESLVCVECNKHEEAA